MHNVKISQFVDLEKKLQEVQSCFLKKNQTLSVAESCTGGLLSYWLTELPGASGFFLGSIVSYSNFVKKTFFKVPEKVLETQGAVNETVCSLMTQGIKNLYSSHWAVSITGIAGPQRGQKDPPIGTIFVGVLGPEYHKVERILLKEKKRQDIKHQSALFALDFLHSSIK